MAIYGCKNDTIHIVLKTHFRYDSFRDNQLDIIQSIISDLKKI